MLDCLARRVILAEMETDTFFYQLFKQLPQAVFEAVGLPAQRARAYRFESVELKKSLRIDGLFIPNKSSLPLLFAEVQFQRLEKFYANLFAKVFGYLDDNDPGQEWLAVAIFPKRRLQPKILAPSEDLLQSKRVTRIFLDELPILDDPPLGLGIMQLAAIPVDEVKGLTARLIRKAEVEIRDSELSAKVIELVEELLIRRFSQFAREEIRTMFQLHDLRKTRVWQEAREEGVEVGVEIGREEGRKEGREAERQELVRKCLANGMSTKEIASLMGITPQQLRQLTKGK